MASGQFGMVSAEQARTIGLDSKEWGRLPGAGWTRLTDRVVRLDGVPPTTGERAMAAILDQGGGARLSHRSSGWWWGAGGFSAHDLQLVTSTRSRHRTSLATVHTVRFLPDRWVTVFRQMPIVRPELCILQLCATLHEDRAGRALDNLWRDGLLSGRSLDLFLAELGRRGRDGVALLRRLREARPGDYVPPATNLERRAIEVLAGFGIEWRRQVDLGAEMWTGRVDLYADRRPLVVEVQSEKFHTALLDRQADDLRRRRLEDDGFVVVEITDEEVWCAPDVARRRVAEALRSMRRHA
jgi:very-short-patch-repair endonuclease